MRQQRVDAVLHHLAHGIEELVDRRPDGDDHRAAAGDLRRRCREHQSVLLQRLRQQCLAAKLDEGQMAALQGLEHAAIEVVDIDAKAGLGECQHQGNADVPAAADNGQIGIADAHGRRGGWIGTSIVHARTPAVTPGPFESLRSRDTSALVLHRIRDIRASSAVISQPSALYKGRRLLDQSSRGTGSGVTSLPR
jgi:hypothetical protein